MAGKLKAASERTRPRWRVGSIRGSAARKTAVGEAVEWFYMGAIFTRPQIKEDINFEVQLCDEISLINE